jgi:hypothetical protein
MKGLHVMNYLDWVPPISTTGAFAVILWLSRTAIQARITKSVQHEFDEKLETLRTTLRKNEEVFKAELREKAAQIEVLRSGAISGLMNRQAVLYKRRIEAVEKLWAAIGRLAPAKNASTYLVSFKFEETLKETAKKPELQAVFEMLGKTIDLKKLSVSDISNERPFVSKIAWALYSAYQAIVTLAVLKLTMLQTGIDRADFIDKNSTLRLVEAALPHQKEYIKEHGDIAYHFLLEELEQRLLDELQKIIQGEESDKAGVEQAAKILTETERIMRDISDTNPN